MLLLGFENYWARMDCPSIKERPKEYAFCILTHSVLWLSHSQPVCQEFGLWSGGYRTLANPITLCPQTSWSGGQCSLKTPRILGLERGGWWTRFHGDQEALWETSKGRCLLSIDVWQESGDHEGPAGHLVMVNLHCKPDRIWNRLGNTAVGTSVRVFPERIKWRETWAGVS